jgi:glycosyltransferase involved in cell wall biosynthesis
MGKWETEGEYFRKIYKLYEKLPPFAQSRIHFMGGVPNSDLKAVYHGADYLMNLSVHNDEDYGMSVAEAQCCGLPAILTDWGGLAGFERSEIPEATKFIPVKIGLKSKVISIEAVKKAISEVINSKKRLDRKNLSQLALKEVSIDTASEVLKKIYQGEWYKFKTFSPFFEKTLLKTTFSPLPYLTESRKVNSIYREIYSSYVRND